MGFIGAIRDLGIIETNRYSDSEYADIDSYLQPPMQVNLPDDDSASGNLTGREILVSLDVVDPQAATLEVRGIKKIEIADFYSGQETDREKNRRYLFKDPVGANVKWRFTPIYKLGKGVANGSKELLGANGCWQKDTSSRFYKLYNSTLKAFEEKKVFSAGSAELIMRELVKLADEIVNLWNDKKRSYILIISPCQGDRFLYPLEVASFLLHFRERQKETSQGSGESARRNTDSFSCAVCYSKTDAPVNMDKIFAFATFDKESFLPGADGSDKTKTKVFPMCQDCYRLLSEGRNLIDKKFLDSKSIYGVSIYVVPELIMGNSSLPSVSGRTKDFIEKGLAGEEYLSEKVMKQDDELVLHFVFWEKNQAQERLLLMAEDVPPSRLKRLEKLWEESEKISAWAENAAEDNSLPLKKSSLQQAMSTIWRTLISLSGKSDNDAVSIRESALDIIGRLLSNEKVEMAPLKSLMVSRFSGLCSDSEWIKLKSRRSAYTMLRIIDFLHKANER